MFENFVSLEDLMNGTKSVEIDQKASCWQNIEGKYQPIQDVSIIKELPSGCYKIAISRDQYQLEPYDLHNDQIYRFQNTKTKKIIDEISDFWGKEELYKKHNLIHKRGLLLTGPPGNSKTSTINLIIEDLLKEDGLIFIANSIRDLDVLIPALQGVVRKIHPTRKIITIIEDIDKIIKLNSMDDSFLLDFLDGKNSIDHHLVILTSNDTSCLSPALLRPSRIDMHYVLPLPNFDTRKEYLKYKGINEELLDEYADKSDGLSFAQLKELFISTQILGKDIDKTIEQLNYPIETKDYLMEPQKLEI